MTASRIRLAVCGAAGRMGRAVVQVAASDEKIELVSAVDAPGCQGLGRDIGVLSGIDEQGIVLGDDIAVSLAHAQAVIDFSTPTSTASLLKECIRLKMPTVIGTTGLRDTMNYVHELAGVAPVVHAPNFSQGVTVMFYLAEMAARLLGDAYDAEIIEMHHRHKMDAPSGTALRLAEGVARARDVTSDAFVYGREGQVGQRRNTEIGVLALRGGGVVGDHTLILADPSERLELVHRAQDRAVFARGAVRAAHWVVEQPPGLYDMFDVLGIQKDAH